MKISSNRATAKILAALAFSGSVLMASTPAPARDGPEPIFEKPAPITMTELSQQQIKGVSAIEVNDYSPCGYEGELKPSPPHADLNPKKAVIIAWENSKARFVFSHEASYCPWLELPNKVGMCNQFFEGNLGWAELMNSMGRKEKNSFVDIIQSGPDLAWVRWTYFCVNKNDDSKPALRGTEDYVAYPNGLVWRRMTYQSMLPDKVEGYAFDPIDFFAIIPPGVPWQTLIARDPEHGDYCVASVLDAYSDKQYDVYWADPGPGTHGFGCGKARRTGDAALLKQISQSKGLAMVIPFKDGYLFSIVGDAGGIPREMSEVSDNSFLDTGGYGWISWELDHWPVGWTNSQSVTRQWDSPYPYCICQLSHYITAKWLDRYKPDYTNMTRNMQHNKWCEQHVFYQVIGVGKDYESIRRLARQWLDKGEECATAQSIADLRVIDR